MSSKNSGLIAYYCNFRFCRENAVHFVVLAIFYVALCSLVNTWCSLPAAAEEISILLLLLVFELLRYRRKPKEASKDSANSCKGINPLQLQFSKYSPAACALKSAVEHGNLEKADEILFQTLANESY